MTLSHRQRSSIGYALLAAICIIIGVTGAFSYSNFSRLITLTSAPARSYQVLYTLDNILSVLKDIETEENSAFAGTQAPSLMGYRAATQEITQQINTLRSLIADHPDQQVRLDALEPLVSRRLDYSAQLIEIPSGGKRGDADELLLGGRELTKEIRKAITGMKETELALVDRHSGSLHLQKRSALLTIFAGSLLCIMVIMSYHLFMRRQIVIRKKDQETLKQLLISVESSSDLVVVTDKWGTIEYVNKAVEHISGFARAELIGKSRDIWKSGKHDDKFFAKMQETLHAGLPFSGVVTYRAKNGELFHLEETATPVRNEQGVITHLISTGKDLTRQKNLEEKLNYLSYYDVLTGMPNRGLFIDRLEQGAIKAHQTGTSLAVLAIDIDRFKLVNDVFGFNAGNDILIAITDRLTSTVGGGDTVARIGNDEFAIVLNNIARPSDITAAVERIMKNVREPIMLRGEEIVLSLTVGIAVHPDDGRNAETLMRNAHIALSKAKSEGRNNYQFFTKHITRKASEAMFMEKRLYSALEKEEYVVHYQPYVDMTTKRVGGAEALIKWRSDKHGMVAPSKFIPMLEDSGMIIDVGEWVLRTACRQIKKWDQESSQFPVAVNLSLIQLRNKHLVDRVRQIINDYAIDPSRLTLEVTEGMCIHDLDFTGLILGKLKDIGVSISVDDFGTGYSSLSYLKKLPVDNVKIDMSFVKDITTDPDAASIVSAITTLARTLNLKTIAEGVETEEQWKILRLLRCDMGQGFLFSPAVPAQEINRFMSRPR